VKQLQRGWLQQSQILAVKCCSAKPGNSDKEPLGSGAENSQKHKRCYGLAVLLKRNKHHPWH